MPCPPRQPASRSVLSSASEQCGGDPSGSPVRQRCTRKPRRGLAQRAKRQGDFGTRTRGAWSAGGVPERSCRRSKSALNARLLPGTPPASCSPALQHRDRPDSPVPARNRPVRLLPLDPFRRTGRQAPLARSWCRPELDTRWCTDVARSQSHWWTASTTARRQRAEGLEEAPADRRGHAWLLGEAQRTRDVQDAAARFHGDTSSRLPAHIWSAGGGNRRSSGWASQTPPDERRRQTVLGYARLSALAQPLSIRQPAVYPRWHAGRCSIRTGGHAGVNQRELTG